MSFSHTWQKRPSVEEESMLNDHFGSTEQGLYNYFILILQNMSLFLLTAGCKCKEFIQIYNADKGKEK